LKTYDGKQGSYSTALGKLGAAVKAEKGDAAKQPDDVTSATSDAAAAAKVVKSDYKTVTDDLAALTKVTDDSKIAAAQGSLKSALSDYKDAVSKYQDPENSLASALSAWNSAPSDDTSKPKPGAKPGPTNASSGPSDAVANDVAIIVQTIVWQSFVTEQCQRALFQNFKTTDPSVRDFCFDHLKKADDVRAQQLVPHLTANNGSPVSPPPQYVRLPTSPTQPSVLFSVDDKAHLEQALQNAMQEIMKSKQQDQKK
jgi:hypothetical protein